MPTGERPAPAPLRLPLDRAPGAAGGPRHRVGVPDGDGAGWAECLAAYVACLLRYDNDPVVVSVAWPDGTPRSLEVCAEAAVSLGELLDLVRADDGGPDVPSAATAGRHPHPRPGLVDLSTSDGIALTADAGALDLSTVERMAGHLGRLLETLRTAPGTAVGGAPLLDERERETLRAWGGTPDPTGPTRFVQDLVGQHAATDPDAPAVIWQGQPLSYGELDAAANRLAHQLGALGVGPEHVVGVVAAPGPELVLAPLAVLRAGGAYLPLEARYPAARLARVLADASARVLLTQRALIGELPDLPGVTVVAVDDDPPPWAGLSATAPRVPVHPAGLAYVIYTSGSTGMPKGVMVEHRNLWNLVAWHTETYAVTPADRATMIAGYGFDASVWELWPYLAAGASVAVAPDQARRDPGALCSWLRAVGATIGFVPTPLVAPVLEQSGGLPMRAVLTGGDRLTRRPPAGWGPELINHYGPTEGAVVATSAPVRTDSDPPPPIGRPIAGVTAQVLDRWGGLAPIGVPGELFLGGAGIARGYLGLPGLTAARFSAQPHGRRYRTGDRVRWTPGGELEFLGRGDHQVKINGHRIECGEVEAALRALPAVRDAVVVARGPDEARRRLVGYVVAAGGAAPDRAGLRSALRLALPEWMVPGALVLLPELPVTRNGKIDRDALPDPDDHVVRSDPRTPVERALAAIWVDLLPVDRVGVEDNFFARGGDSVLAVELVVRARQQGLRFDLAAVFNADTLAELAAGAGAPR